jgi:hypothetical protein
MPAQLLFPLPQGRTSLHPVRIVGGSEVQVAAHAAQGGFVILAHLVGQQSTCLSARVNVFEEIHSAHFFRQFFKVTRGFHQHKNQSLQIVGRRVRPG